MACPQLGVILAYWKQTGVSSPKNPIALAVGVSMVFQVLESPLGSLKSWGKATLTQMPRRTSSVVRKKWIGSF